MWPCTLQNSSFCKHQRTWSNDVHEFPCDYTVRQSDAVEALSRSFSFSTLHHSGKSSLWFHLSKEFLFLNWKRVVVVFIFLFWKSLNLSLLDFLQQSSISVIVLVFRGRLGLLNLPLCSFFLVVYPLKDSDVRLIGLFCVARLTLAFAPLWTLATKCKFNTRLNFSRNIEETRLAKKLIFCQLSNNV